MFIFSFALISGFYGLYIDGIQAINHMSGDFIDKHKIYCQLLILGYEEIKYHPFWQMSFANA